MLRFREANSGIYCIYILIFAHNIGALNLNHNGAQGFFAVSVVPSAQLFLIDNMDHAMDGKCEEPINPMQEQEQALQEYREKALFPSHDKGNQ